MLEGVRGCWSGVGAAWNVLECVGMVLEGLEGVGVAWNCLEQCVGVLLEWCWSGLEGVGMAWNGVGVVLEWLGVAWNSVEGC